MNPEGRTTTQLSTIDTAGRRLWVYPSDVRGRFRAWRTKVSAVLLVVFLALPWLRLDGQQAVWLDLWNGKFSVFGLRLWSHDAPMLLFVVGGAIVSLAFVTAVWGRIWCGWACPQTVFVDLVFRRVERWIEGDAVTRRRVDQGPWTEGKALRKVLKWSAYSLISLVLSHSFLAYFIGTEALAAMILEPPARNLGSFVAMGVMTAAVLFDFGWLREQFCALVCPYGRLQSVLMDERSLAVAYDRERQADCIDCRKCVQVCPTGIDIRDGLQMECIACTACIDACDQVMTKIRKPVGLIRYTAQRGGDWRRFARPGAYLATLSVIAGGLTWAIAGRVPVDIELVRRVGAPYDEVIRPGLEKEIVNSFKLDLLNQTFGPVEIALAETPELVARGIQLVAARLPIRLEAGQSARVDLLIRFPISEVPHGSGAITIRTITRSDALSEPFIKPQEVPLVAPLR